MTTRRAAPQSPPCRIHADRPATHVRQYVRRTVPAWDTNSIGVEHLCRSCALQAERYTGQRVAELTSEWVAS